jgi:DNA-binding response OmpR family regulator
VTAHILVVEDDADICRSLQILFQRAGYNVSVASDGESGVERFLSHPPDLVVLDISMPVMDGWAVLDRIRNQSQTPVLMLTARGLESEKVRGLLGGADDYMTKPFSNDELVARVAARLRRSPLKGDRDMETIFDDGFLYVNFSGQIVKANGEDVILTPTEFRLLAALVRHAGQVLSTDQLLEWAWHDPTGIGPGRVKFTVLSLRRKLDWTDLATSPVETVRGFGYRYRIASQ